MPTKPMSDLERAAQLLEWCASAIRFGARADELERFPYVPELDEVAEQLRAALTAAQADLAACKRSLLQEETEHNATRAALEAARGE